MRKKKLKGILALSLSSILAMGMITTGAMAQTMNPTVQMSDQIIEIEVDDFTLDYQKYVEMGVISAEELARLQGVHEEVDKLYAHTNDKTAEEEWHAIDEKAALLYEQVSDIENKINAQEEALLNADLQAYYDSLVNNGVVTWEELDALLEAYDQVETLYTQVTDESTEAQLKTLDEQANALMEQVAPIADKVAAYDDKQEQMEQAAWFEELVEKGVWTTEDKDKVVATLQEIENLYAPITNETEEANVDHIVTQADKLYEDIQPIFDKITSET